MNTQLQPRPLIAISRCLLGENVRYDGQVRHDGELIRFIQQHFDCIAVCPEVEIGLSVPRPAVQLYSSPRGIRMAGRDQPEIDITAAMQTYCQQRPPQLSGIQGYIFKSRSPSCGLQDIPRFNQQGTIEATGAGLFAEAMVQHFPELPITDEQTLQEQSQRSHFLQQVKHYQARKCADTI